MKVAHNTAWFLPDTFGGTEIYVASLARELEARGMPQVVLTPREKPEQAVEYSQDGTSVFRYQVEGGPADSAPFADALRQTGADVYHLHTWTSTAGIRELREAHRQDKGCVVTFHTYAAICANETLMRYDRETCDGKIRKFACSTCYLHHRGRPLGLARVMASSMLLFHEFQRRKDELEELAELADAIVAPAAFVRDALLRNGIEPSKIILSRQGYGGALPEPRRPAAAANGTFRIGIIGRIDALKGTDIIVDAVRRLPKSEPIELEVIGAPAMRGTARDPDAYFRGIRNAAATDSRIRLVGPLPHAETMKRLADLDLLAVPSRCQETGPLTAMEAIAHRVPVLGSHLGGLPETVGDSVHGKILRSLDPRDWAAAIQEILRDRSLLDRWRCGGGRTMRDAADDMVRVYERVSARP